jgi:hypothetical protein
MADNVHWLRDTYGPALRAFYGDLLKQPIPQRFVDLIQNLEAQAALEAATPAPDDGRPAAAQQHEPQPDTSE